MSEGSPAPISPRDSAAKALTPSVLQEALSKDVGPEAKFKSFEVKDFCSKGDNFACYVTSVAVKYVLGSEEKCASYVAKLNQLGQLENQEEFTANIFEKEGRFYCELVPALNQLRRTLHLPPLKYPSCFYASFEAGHEVILLEDMREKSFCMAKTKHSLNSDHVLMVMKEFAQLHASSVLLEEHMGSENFNAIFNFLKDTFTSEAMTPVVKDSLTGYVQNGVRAAEKLGGHEELIARLAKVAPKAMEFMDAATSTCDPKFRVVNHGDVWKNNMLFRYDSDNVVDLCLLDLQINRHVSLGIELNHFFFSSVDRNSRKINMMNFLSTYYDSFKQVFDIAKKPMKFTLEELCEEYRRKNTYGVLLGFMTISMLGLKTEDMPDFSALKEDNVSTNVDASQLKLFEALEVNPVLRYQLSGLLEEIEQNRIY